MVVFRTLVEFGGKIGPGIVISVAYRIPGRPGPLEDGQAVGFPL
jgi:hypothetical protein